MSSSKHVISLSLVNLSAETEAESDTQRRIQNDQTLTYKCKYKLERKAWIAHSHCPTQLRSGFQVKTSFLSLLKGNKIKKKKPKNPLDYPINIYKPILMKANKKFKLQLRPVL